jgi:hypothetical protein
MLRMARFEQPGLLCHIMAHSIEGRKLFVDDDKHDFLSRFEKGLKDNRGRTIFFFIQCSSVVSPNR